MFAESLLESGTSRRARRGWTTVASFTLQAALLSLLAIIPVLYPQALTLVQRAPEIPIFSNAPQPVPMPENSRHTSSTSRISITLLSSTGLHYGKPRAAVEGTDIAPPAPWLPGSGPNPAMTSDISGPAVKLSPPNKPISISSMDPGSLIHQVQPIYPAMAIQSRTEGAVVLGAMISTEGTIESLHVISGHPLLSKAALDAVRQWRYRPYILNGQPVEVETQITVNFKLGS